MSKCYPTHAKGRLISNIKGEKCTFTVSLGSLILSLVQSMSSAALDLLSPTLYSGGLRVPTPALQTQIECVVSQQQQKSIRLFQEVAEQKQLLLSIEHLAARWLFFLHTDVEEKKMARAVLLPKAVGRESEIRLDLYNVILKASWRAIFRIHLPSLYCPFHGFHIASLPALQSLLSSKWKHSLPPFLLLTV